MTTTTDGLDETTLRSPRQSARRAFRLGPGQGRWQNPATGRWHFPECPVTVDHEVSKGLGLTPALTDRDCRCGDWSPEI